MSRQRDEGRVAEAARLYASGQTAPEVAAVLGVHERTIRAWLGEAVRRTGPRGITDVTDQRILDLRKDGLSFELIAARVHMSKTGVRKRYARLSRESYEASP